MHERVEVPWSRTLALAAAVLAVPAAETAAQVAGGERAPFDEARAYLAEETIFEPFLVGEADVTPLREALAAGAVRPDTWLLVMEHDAGRLALVMDQLAYHHVAQGTLRGEPWMVSF